MRHIDLSDGMRLRFPNRGEDFDQGVEIGILAVMMDYGTREFARAISPGSLEQARALAEKMGYRLVVGADEGDRIEVTLRSGAARPALKLVHSRAS